MHACDLAGLLLILSDTPPDTYTHVYAHTPTDELSMMDLTGGSL